MRDFLALLRPHKGPFFLAVFALLFAAVFHSAMSAMVAPLLNSVMTQEAQGGGEGETESVSMVDQIFGLGEVLSKLESWLVDLGVPIEQMTDIATSGPDLINPLPWSLLLVFLFGMQAFFDYLGTYTMAKVGLRVITNMRQELMDHVLQMPLGFYKHYSTGDLIARINTDVLRMQQAISVKMGELLKELAMLLVYLIIAFALNWKLSLTLFVLVPLIGYPIAIFSRKIRRYASTSQNFLGTLTSQLKEVLVGIRIVKGFRREAHESNRLRKENMSFLKYALREIRIVALTTPIMGILGILVIVSFVYYGSLLVQSGAMTTGDFMYFLLVIYMLYQPIKRITRANSEIQQAVGVLPRLREVLNWRNDIEDPASPQRFADYPAIEKVSFKDVTFRYNQDQNPPVLDKVSFAIERGQVVALVGASGSGKSTIANLLPRFYDIADGQIQINGMDIRQMSKHDLRGLFAMVTQDTILFNDTVAANIAYAVDNASQDAIEAAAKKAFADGFIEALPQGYQTVIGESGSNLSGGQRQRLSIARAILSDAPILILDEATSALDTESEREVQAALENLMKMKTTLVIAHRLSTIRSAHQILVMETGHIVERGNHDDLMAAGGIYRRLVQLQEEGHHAL
jgi:subfamily B ATP-binding cassette protein MsbA